MREWKPSSFVCPFSLTTHAWLFCWWSWRHPVKEGWVVIFKWLLSETKKATKLQPVPKFLYLQAFSQKRPCRYKQLRVAIPLMVLRRRLGLPCLPPPPPPPPRPHIHSSFPLHFTSGPHPTRVHKAASEGRDRWGWSHFCRKTMSSLRLIWEGGHKALQQWDEPLIEVNWPYPCSPIERVLLGYSLALICRRCILELELEPWSEKWPKCCPCWQLKLPKTL